MRAELVRRDGGGGRAEHERRRGEEEEQEEGCLEGVVQGCIVDATIHGYIRIALVTAARVTHPAAPALPRETPRVTHSYHTIPGPIWPRYLLLLPQSHLAGPSHLWSAVCGLWFVVCGLR